MFRSQSGDGVYSAEAAAESESKISDSVHIWYFELIEVGYFIIISIMVSFMRVSQKLVFHQSKCIRVIKRILSTTAMCMYLRLPSYICVFHVTASAIHV